MQYSISEPMIFVAGCLVYIVSGLFCGMVRWFHMCHPYDLQEGFFYPARRQTAFFYAMLVLQFPYLLNPTDPDVWFYIRIFGILYYPLCFSMLFRRYFREEHIKHNFSIPFYLLIGFGPIVVILLLLMAGRGDLLHLYEGKLLYAMGCFSLLLTTGLIRISMWIGEHIDRFHQDNYSNEDDFPYVFAKRVIYVPLIWIVAMWAIFITVNPWVKLVVDLLCAFWMVLSLITILHPQKMFCRTADSPIVELEDQVVKQMEDKMENDQADAEVEAGTEVPEAEVEAEVRREVLAVVLSKFKEPHLQKQDVLSAFAYGRKKEANRFIMQVGYYNLVNMFRLRYAELYTEAHPNATKDTIASESGFTSRFTYYKAKNAMISIDPDLVRDVRL